MNDKDLEKLVELKDHVTKLIRDINVIKDKEHKIYTVYKSEYSRDLSLNFSNRYSGEYSPLEAKIRDHIVQELMLEVVKLVSKIKEILPSYEVTDVDLKKIIDQQKASIESMRANLDQTKSILDNYAG